MMPSLSLPPKIKNWPHWSKLLIGITLLAIVSVLYINLGRDTLFNWDEGIYAELGREQIITGDILTPHWNNDLWLEKPPGIAWVTALSMSIFGTSEFGARAFMPLFALATLFFVYKIGEKLGGWRYGALSMTLLATFDLFLARSRAVNTDGMLLAALTGTILASLSSAPAIFVAIGIAVGVWAKGIAGIIIAVLVLPLLLKRGISFTLRAAIYTLIFVLPWHIYQYLENRVSFYTPYLLEQVVRRATVPIEFHMESRWFYFQFLVENLRGGVLYLLLAGIAIIIYQSLKSLKAKNLKSLQPLFLLYWLAVPLVIFTLAKTRLYWYILPLYPAIALIIAYVFTRFQRDRLERSMLLVMIIGLCGQSILSVASSVEIGRRVAPVPLDVQLAKEAQKFDEGELAILVPESERVAEAILPASQRISSSFRYGGSPSLVFYSQKHVTYYYNVDDWILALSSKPSLTLFAVGDLARLPKGYVVERLNASHVLARGSQDVIR